MLYYSTLLVVREIKTTFNWCLRDVVVSVDGYETSDHWLASVVSHPISVCL